MLVVVKNRYIHPLAASLLDYEALWCFDVFKVYSSKCRLKRTDDINNFTRICLIQFNVEYVDGSKFFEQDGLAFHHGL